MVITTIRAKASPGKRRELSQALSALLSPTRECVGCLGCRACEDLDDQDVLSLVAEWTSEEHFAQYRASHTGGVLLGAFQALCEGTQIILSRVSSQEQIEVTTAGNGE